MLRLCVMRLQRHNVQHSQGAQYMGFCSGMGFCGSSCSFTPPWRKRRGLYNNIWWTQRVTQWTPLIKKLLGDEHSSYLSKIQTNYYDFRIALTWKTSNPSPQLHRLCWTVKAGRSGKPEWPRKGRGLECTNFTFPAAEMLQSCSTSFLATLWQRAEISKRDHLQQI